MLRNFRYYAPGMGIIVLGLIVAVFPAVLVGIVAGTLIMAGIGAIYFGHHVRQLHRELGTWDDARISHFSRDPYTAFEHSFFTRLW